MPSPAGWAALGGIDSSGVGACAAYAPLGKAAYCWGLQLGTDGALANYSTPTAVPAEAAASWRQLSSGGVPGVDAFNCERVLGLPGGCQRAAWVCRLSLGRCTGLWAA